MVKNLVSSLAPSFLFVSSSFLLLTITTLKFRTNWKFSKIQPQIVELTALERTNKTTLIYKGRNSVSTQVPSFLEEYSSLLQVPWTTIQALRCLFCLPGVTWWLSGSSSRCHSVVCGLWLWYILIILTYYFWWGYISARSHHQLRSWLPLVVGNIIG